MKNLGLLGGSPTLTNLGNDHGFISKEYISISTRPFGKTKNKTMKAYAQSRQYHTIMEGRDSNIMVLVHLYRCCLQPTITPFHFITMKDSR